MPRQTTAYIAADVQHPVDQQALRNLTDRTRYRQIVKPLPFEMH